MLLLSMMLTGLIQDSDLVTSAMIKARAMTRAEIPCDRSRDSDEIVVCANRDADRYRISVIKVRSSRDLEPRTPALIDARALPCGQGAFTVNCGKAGVSVSRVFGSGTGSGDVTFDTDREKGQ